MKLIKPILKDSIYEKEPKGIITQLFGENLNPIYAQWGQKGHGGIDIAAPVGTPVYASHDGYIFFAGTDKYGGIGVKLVNTIEMFFTLYWHLESFVVAHGQTLKQGELLGYSGKTGWITGAHLHFGLCPIQSISMDWYVPIDKENGYAGFIDPLPYLNNTTIMLQLIKRQNDEDVYAIIDNKRYQIGDINTAHFWNGKLWELGSQEIVDDLTFAKFPKGGVILTTQSD